MTPLWPQQREFGAAGVPQGDRVAVTRRQPVQRPGSGVKTLGPWAEALTHHVDGVGLDRTSSSTLAGDQGDSRIQTATVFAPHAADIRQGDRIEFPDGVLVYVDGIPDRSKNLFTGWKPPMTVLVQVTHG